REFRVFASPSGLLSVAGGKYTTYRHMAEVITDEVCRRLGRRRWRQTHHFPLDGTPAETWDEFAPREVADLARRHGLKGGAAPAPGGRLRRRGPGVGGVPGEGALLGPPGGPGRAGPAGRVRLPAGPRDGPLPRRPPAAPHAAGAVPPRLAPPAGAAPGRG